MIKNDVLIIPTLEGTMAAEIGSYIIRGIKGEYYPCRGDIFEDTYEEVKFGKSYGAYGHATDRTN